MTDTVTGAPVAGFTALIAGSRLTVSAPGYVTRETRSIATSVDLIPEASFDLEFYRQFARDALDGALDPLRVLSTAPSIYMQTGGLSASNVAALEQAAREVVPALTGGRFNIATLESGAEARSERAGWVVVDIVSDAAQPCGNSRLGTAAGHIWLNADVKCNYAGNRVDPSVMAHELGHALGFSHVRNDGALLSKTRHEWGRVVVTDLERRHAAIAYHRQAGNRDVDVDP